MNNIDIVKKLKLANTDIRLVYEVANYIEYQQDVIKAQADVLRDIKDGLLNPINGKWVIDSVLTSPADYIKEMREVWQSEISARDLIIERITKAAKTEDINIIIEMLEKVVK